MIEFQSHYSAPDDAVHYLHNQNEQTRLKSESIHALPRGWHVGHIDTSCIHSLVPSNAGGTTVPLHCDPLHHELPGSLLDMWTTAALDCALNSKCMCLVHQNAISHADDMKKLKAQDIGSRSKAPWPSAHDVQLFLHVGYERPCHRFDVLRSMSLLCQNMAPSKRGITLFSARLQRTSNESRDSFSALN